jgi:hypothetical protein
MNNDLQTKLRELDKLERDIKTALRNLQSSLESSSKWQHAYAKKLEQY